MTAHANLQKNILGEFLSSLPKIAPLGTLAAKVVGAQSLEVHQENTYVALMLQRRTLGPTHESSWIIGSIMCQVCKTTSATQMKERERDTYAYIPYSILHE